MYCPRANRTPLQEGSRRSDRAEKKRLGGSGILASACCSLDSLFKTSFLLEMRSHGALRVPRHFSSHLRVHICSSRPGYLNATRCASTSLRPLQSHHSPLDRRWQQRRRASVAAAVYVPVSARGFRANLTRLEQAAEPENLAQETIIQNLAPQEAQRLSRVRNIGIAVSMFGLEEILA